MSKLAVLILAAGSSSRMGVPKQLLKWKDTTLLQHSINSVNKINDVNILVLGANFEKIERTVNSDNISVLLNKNWKKGLGNSIAFGIKFIKESLPKIKSVLIMLADQPLIDSSYLNNMIRVHNLNPNKIISTLYNNNRLGVPAIFNRAYFEDLLQLGDDKGAKELLKKHINNVVTIDGLKVVSDIDTIEDYETLYKIYH